MTSTRISFDQKKGGGGGGQTRGDALGEGEKKRRVIGRKG